MNKEVEIGETFVYQGREYLAIETTEDEPCKGCGLISAKCWVNGEPGVPDCTKGGRPSERYAAFIDITGL